MALGATRRDVVLLVIRQAAWPVGFGIAIGVVVSIGTSRLLTNQLFGVSPGDPTTVTAVALSLAAVALLASFVPAARAASASPTNALRCD
jgi:ABC-type antimicrobial peptide transport system permease subunit